MFLFKRCLCTLIGLTLVTLLQNGASADENDEIVTGCHHSNAEWGLEAIERCINDNKITRELVLQHPEKHKAIVERCRRRNELGWSWVKNCVDKDIEAETALADYPRETADLVKFCHAEIGHRGAAAVKKCVDQVIDRSRSPKPN